ncbi:uncharacterized protein LOC129724675 [Wyeomyia smithii]|uniref:uncharacterized protein LOC129724675 n=1 Tax=Wyeomyia smithii TaxID=174621 RepID=UPI002467EAFF|nr:uncharacterized protein LOC129724675 [Wyeomyia smithii]
MKFFLSLVGTVCFATIIQAQSQSTVSINVAGNVTLGLAGINTTIAAINATILKADAATLAAWTNFTKTMITNLTSLMDRFGSYPSSISSQLSSLNNTIVNLKYQLNNTGPYLLSTDYALNDLFMSVYQVANQTGSFLNDVALNMSSQAICTNDYSVSCLRKYGANLTATPILMSRFNNCLAAENTRIGAIGTNVTAQMNSSIATAQSFINLISICNVPTAAALNQSWPQFVPSAQCLSSYLNQIASQSQITSADFMYAIQSVQVQMVVFRANRCAQLAQYDIQDATVRVQAAFTKCLTTGS